MFIRPALGFFALSACALLSSPSRADDTAPAPQCALDQHRVVAVEPYRVETRIGYGYVTELRGAQLYIQAEPGLTPEWLRLVLGRELAGAANSAGGACAVFGDDVHVEVVSAGPGMWVQVIARDARSGEDVLGRARRLVR